MFQQGLLDYAELTRKRLLLMLASSTYFVGKAGQRPGDEIFGGRSSGVVHVPLCL